MAPRWAQGIGVTSIHPTAIVEDGAELAEDVEVGPFCMVGPQVRLSKGVRLVSHVVVAGHTTLGEDCMVYPFASLGHPPQHLKYAGEDVTLEVGPHTIIREHVTMNPGTAVGRGRTVVGTHGFFMASSHVAHDCKVGNHVIFANGAVIGGHVDVGDHVMLGGHAAVHQWSRIGAHAFVGGMAGLEGDLIPFGSCMGNRAHLAGLNIVGLKRRGFTREKIHRLRNAYRLLFAEEGTLAERLDDVAELFAESPEVMEIVAFIRAQSNRPLCLPSRG
ncbi:MAG: acyl-ACP--UDP-N-acetylglucosamine O-acyltransferase [Alphaproteobacteria bacterium]|nr:acyl-ACP--UDP-N-acetylglucosamine O-acyltransferase [Alphaproteobacteria bacterium]